MGQNGKPVSILDCIQYKGKLYRPGTVFKVSEQWIKDHYEYQSNGHCVELYTYNSRFYFDYNPCRYSVYSGGKSKLQCGGFLLIKSMYWKFVSKNRDTNMCSFVPVINPYVTREDCYFVEETFSNPRLKGITKSWIDIRTRILDLNHDDLLPDYVDINHILTKETCHPEYDKNRVSEADAQGLIEEVVEPLEWSRKHGATENDSAEAVIGWVIYIAAMIAASIFVDRVFIWIFLTIAWIFIRQMILNNVKGA